MLDASSTRRPRVALLTLGCAKNLVDSEQIAAALERAGARVTTQLDGADLAIVNTCGFIQAAREESIDAILEAGTGKGREGPASLLVAGCMGERYADDLAEALPEADAVTGVDPAEAVRAALELLGLPVPGQAPSPPRRRRLTPRAWSYLRIAHGCENRCAYCAIPLIRGPLRSRPADELLAEARALAATGVREINVIAQDTANYGVDAEGRRTLHELLPRLCAVDGLAWVRLLYLHPAHLYDELLDAMAVELKLCPYVDLPLQHVGDRILSAMGRGITRAEIEELIGRVRRRLPQAAVRTTFITGFPGETDAEFEELLAFVRGARFERLGAFAYSPEEGTAAAGLPDQVPQEVAVARRDELMAAQQEIAFALAAGREGEETLVLMEEGGGEGDLRPARSPKEAPDVDPLIYVAGDDLPPAGQFARVRIVGSAGYDCVAEPIAEEDR